MLLAFPVAGQTRTTDQFTPVIALPLTSSTQPFPGTDGKYHVVYELLVTNTKPTPATLKKIEVLDAESEGPNSNVLIAGYEGDALASRLRTLANTPAGHPEIEFNGTRLFLIDLTFASLTQIPGRLQHRLQVMGASGPAPIPTTPEALTYTVAPLEVHTPLREIGPPLAGKGWVALNGCCEPGGAHRASGLSVNGWIYFGQRFAIDWMRLDEGGRLVHDDPADVHNYTCYGTDVLAVADGTVVSVFDILDNQPPGKLPDPKTMTVENVLGNHVVLDLGGAFAFYAHMEKNSIHVVKGQRVKRGEVLGKLGNTGNTSAPHLHFHLMDGPSPLASSGIPYIIDSFALAGSMPPEKDPAADSGSLEGSFSSGLLPSANPRHYQFPLDLNVIDFPERPAAGKR